MFQCQVANIEPFGSVVTEDTSGFCTVPGYSGTPLPCYQPMSKPRQYYFKCCCIVPTGQSFHSPAPTTRLSCWTPPSEYSSSHLLDSWGALWWTSYATSPGPGSTSITGRATGLWVFGSIFSEKLHLSVYQYNISIFCSGVASGVQCRCALCRVEGGLALVCLCPAAFLWLVVALACLPAGAALHTAPPIY